MTYYRDKKTGEVVEVKPQPFGLYKLADDRKWITADELLERFEPIKDEIEDLKRSETSGYARRNKMK